MWQALRSGRSPGHPRSARLCLTVPGNTAYNTAYCDRRTVPCRLLGRPTPPHAARLMTRRPPPSPLHQSSRFPCIIHHVCGVGGGASPGGVTRTASRRRRSSPGDRRPSHRAARPGWRAFSSRHLAIGAGGGAPLSGNTSRSASCQMAARRRALAWHLRRARARRGAARRLCEHATFVTWMADVPETGGVWHRPGAPLGSRPCAAARRSSRTLIRRPAVVDTPLRAGDRRCRRAGLCRPITGCSVCRPGAARPRPVVFLSFNRPPTAEKAPAAEDAPRNGREERRRALRAAAERTRSPPPLGRIEPGSGVPNVGGGESRSHGRH